MWSFDDDMDDSLKPPNIQKTTRGDTLKQRDRRFVVCQDVEVLDLDDDGLGHVVIEEISTADPGNHLMSVCG